MKLEFFFDRFSKHTQISNFMNFHAVSAEFSQADGRKDILAEANSRFS